MILSRSFRMRIRAIPKIHERKVKVTKGNVHAQTQTGGHYFTHVDNSKGDWGVEIDSKEVQFIGMIAIRENHRINNVQGDGQDAKAKVEFVEELGEIT